MTVEVPIHYGGDNVLRYSRWFHKHHRGGRELLWQNQSGEETDGSQEQHRTRKNPPVTAEDSLDFGGGDIAIAHHKVPIPFQPRSQTGSVGQEAQVSSD